MPYRLIFVLVLAWFLGISPLWADNVLSTYNPDIKKYEFARNYIAALKYMKDINDRWRFNAPKKKFPHDKLKMIVASMNDVALDSSDLRIIKNYMLAYLLSKNMLIRKVADIVVVATSREIMINDQEKRLWQNWYTLNKLGQANRLKEIAFVRTAYELHLKRKDPEKEIIRATVLLTKVLMSDSNKDLRGHRLAITARQRQKLLDKLDSFGHDNLDWGLKVGQSPIESAIAVIREVLEDSIWTAIDEK